jgi:hypothetical protein
MTSFLLTDLTMDSLSATDASTDQSSDNRFIEISNQSDQLASSANVGISGSHSIWQGTIQEQDTDALTAVDQGHDDRPTSSDGNSTYHEQWNSSSSGPMQSTLQAAAAGDNAGNVSIQNLDWTDSGKRINDVSDTAQATVTNGADSSNATNAVTDHCQDQITLHVTSPDGVSGTVNETEALTDNPTQVKSGGDSWNDPATGVYGQSINGTDSGSDQYSQAQVGGSNNATVISSASIDVNGALGAVAFTADIKGTAPVTATGSASDTIALAGETSTDAHTGNENAGETYSVHLDNSTGPTKATITSTITDKQSDTDTFDDTWNNNYGDSGTENDNRTDGNDATVRVNGSATVDSTGAFTPTGGQITIQGTDGFTDVSTIDDDSQVNGVGETDHQNANTNGSDVYTVSATNGADGSTTMSDNESVDEGIAIGGSLQQDGGGLGDNGSVTLSGRLQAGLQQTGRSQGGQLSFNPPTGDDEVDFTGTLNNTTDANQSAPQLYFGSAPSDANNGDPSSPNPPIVILGGPIGSRTAIRTSPWRRKSIAYSRIPGSNCKNQTPAPRTSGPRPTSISTIRRLSLRRGPCSACRPATQPARIPSLTP